MKQLSPRVLKALYWEKKFSSPQIAKMFGCSAGFVRSRLKEFGIPLRSLREALPLSNRSRHALKNFSGNLVEKAYLIGLAKGDLHVYRRGPGSTTILVHTNTTKPNMVGVVQGCFAQYGHEWLGKPAKNGAVCIRYSLNETFRFLLDLRDSIDNWILQDTNYFIAFLAGYADAEGSFCICGGNGVFSIRSQDKSILSQIRSKLIELGVLLRPPQLARRAGTKDIRGTVSNRDIWGLWIYRKGSLLKLLDLIRPFVKHADKHLAMTRVRNNILMRNKKYNRLFCRSKYDKLYLTERINV